MHSTPSSLAIAQLSHPGRQSPCSVSRQPLAPSAVPVSLPSLGGLLSRALFRCPRAMTNVEILHVVHSFAASAKHAEACGFDGVQIHAAHGYLLSQFLSPKTNQRTRFYGGSEVARRRMLMEVIERVRDATGPTFVVGVKINSEDFQVRPALFRMERMRMAVYSCFFSLLCVSSGARHAHNIPRFLCLLLPPLSVTV